MKPTIEILNGLPREELKTLVARGVLRRNAVREVQAIAQYRNLRLDHSVTSVTAARTVAERYGMTERTFYRILKIYEG